jgi:predicted dehydrogenase
MKSALTRRSFIKRTAVAAGALSAAQYIHAPNILAADAGNKLNCVLIGCGGRAMNHLEMLVSRSKENIMAIVDPDEKQHAKGKKAMADRGANPDKTLFFTDYRTMYDKIGKELDVVVVAAPNHHHALASMLAMNLGKAVYCEKPLTHDIAEARMMRKMAAESKAPTQMGNQGHCMDGYHRLCEFVAAKVVGNIIETHSWTDRANGGEGPRPPVKPAPQGMNWDSWIGPAPYRDFHSDLHPHEWHGWYDFGNGSLGNMGCHVLDGVFWALKVEHPVSIEAEEISGGSNERYPLGSKLRFDIPARGDMPAFKAYWYEGLKNGAKNGAAGNLHAARGDDRNFPPLLREMLKQYPDEEIDKPDSGTLYKGEKGVLYTGTYGNKFHILPLEKMPEVESKVPRTMKRIKPEDPMVDLLTAVREGKKETHASFDYGAQLTEFTLLGNLAQHAGVGKKIEWDGPNMKVKNIPELNEWLKRPYRKGWSAAA